MMETIATWFSEQSWYMTAVTIVGAANGVSMWVSDKWADKYPWTKIPNTALNWLSLNIFRNKNKE